MSFATSYVRARIDSETKERATDALQEMGLSVSDAIRLLMIRIAEEHRLPFEVRVPNLTTQSAMEELKTTKSKKASNVDSLMEQLNEGD